MLTRAELQKRDGVFIVRTHHVTPREVNAPVYSAGKPTGEFRRMMQNTGEWKEETFTDEEAAKKRLKTLEAAIV